MTNHFFSNPVKLQHLSMGPLGSYIDMFAILLSKQGYTQVTCRCKINLVYKFSLWLHKKKLRVDDINEQNVSKFLKNLKRLKQIRRGDAETLRMLLQCLRNAKVIADSPKVKNYKLKIVDYDFAQYLIQERGLSQATIINYLSLVRYFISKHFGKSSILLDKLCTSDISKFIISYSKSSSIKRSKWMSTALRGFFRFLYQRGEITTHLAESVPSVANWHLSTLPKSLEKGQVDKLLQSCDQNTTIGQRDYTILLLLARLGLRAGEVAGMMLDDINWEAGEFIIRGKGSRRDLLPIPKDVGKALATYLSKGRPHCSTRKVFIRMKAPHQGFSSSVAICNIVERALKRAGLCPARKGAHLLRHSLAIQMINKGASLNEVGEILRHSSPTTTEIYTKVDIEALRKLAQPWIE